MSTPPLVVTVRRAADLVTKSWGTGPDGTTTELAISAGGDYAQRDFLWRLSTATINVRTSDFTRLPNIYRHLLLLRGQLDLRIGDANSRVLNAGDQVDFDGASATHCTVLSEPPAVDLNLMLTINARGSIAYHGLPPRDRFIVPLNATSLTASAGTPLPRFSWLLYCPPECGPLTLALDALSNADLDAAGPWTVHGGDVFQLTMPAAASGHCTVDNLGAAATHIVEARIAHV